MSNSDHSLGWPANAFQRFFAKVDKSGANGCWVWTGAKSPRGYGMFGVSSTYRSARAHRVAYQMMRGEIPAGFLVCHKCDNPSCVNPDHLFTGTPSQNSADMVRKGRAHQGPRHHKAKLSESDVVAIRADYRADHEIAPLYGVNPSTINRARAGYTWKLLPAGQKERVKA